MLLACVAGAASAAERCVRNPGDHYDEGVAYQLELKGIARRFSAEQGVCVNEELLPEVDDAMRRLDRYFWKIDYALHDPCEERAFVEWATGQKLRFDVSGRVDLEGNPAGRVFRLRSFTQEEVDRNRRKLDEAPKDVTCKPTTVASR